MNWRVPLADLNFDRSELEGALQVIESGWLTMGGVTQAFESAFAQKLGVKHAIAVSNATVGLHLANRVLGVGPGDEVVVPSLTFVATSNAILYQGAKPVFADVTSESDFNISPGAIEAAITPRTKAIMVMHYGGYLCDMPAILEIADRHHLAVIEDAAHAPGASLEGRFAGAWGSVSVFSFFSNKNLATGEGGMLTTDDDDLAEKLRLMRSHGMTSLSWDRHQGHAFSYDVVDLGFNYRIDEIRAAIGMAQLEKLVDGNQRRREITAMVHAQLGELEGLSIPYRRHPGISAGHLCPILLDSGLDRSAFMGAMREAGIQTSIHYPPIHTFSYYRQTFGEIELPLTEAIGAREVTLPLFPTMTDEQVGWVVEAVKDSLESARG
ncbi:MAG: DegT/DnrJ/EryC1/StrS family aminotransferase [Lysobacterales bacterium]|nr:MAG: DegT/DnrJ/EryC1/StrS family aminotransferase [Xanthomonadales bacterium]